MKWLIHLVHFFVYALWLVNAEQGSRSLVFNQSPKVPEKIPPSTRIKPTRYPYLGIKDFKNQRLRAVSAHGRDDGNNDTDTVKHSHITVALRALYLFIIFSPVLISAPLAYIIPIFRRYVWFKLLVNIIGSSLLLSSNLCIVSLHLL